MANTPKKQRRRLKYIVQCFGISAWFKTEDGGEANFKECRTIKQVERTASGLFQKGADEVTVMRLDGKKRKMWSYLNNG